MAQDRLSGKINNLFRREEWEKARGILEREREKRADDHWVVTQLGVTFYEQQRYQEALQLFLSSQKIVPDCPLTLWNLAGTLDALGQYTNAMQIYTWLLRKAPNDDDCWEGKEWADALKTDCVYRVGVCLQHLHKKREAEDCYRQYLDLLSIGIEGSYSIDDVKRQVQDLHGESRASAVDSEVRRAVSATLRASGINLPKGRRNRPPELHVREMIPGHLAANASGDDGPGLVGNPVSH